VPDPRRLLAALERLLADSALVTVHHDGEDWHLDARPRGPGPPLRAAAPSPLALLAVLVDPPPAGKRCPGAHCGGRWWPIGEFNRDRTKKGGRSVHCKLCTREHDRRTRRKRGGVQ
jgi:hypothetical protein